MRWSHFNSLCGCHDCLLVILLFALLYFSKESFLEESNVLLEVYGDGVRSVLYSGADSLFQVVASHRCGGQGRAMHVA